MGGAYPNMPGTYSAKAGPRKKRPQSSHHASAKQQNRSGKGGNKQRFRNIETQQQQWMA